MSSVGIYVQSPRSLSSFLSSFLPSFLPCRIVVFLPPKAVPKSLVMFSSLLLPQYFPWKPPGYATEFLAIILKGPGASDFPEMV